MTEEVFKPDAELMRFAWWFAVNYKELQPGTLNSSNNTYRLRYIDRLLDNGKTCVIRVSEATGVIEYNRTLLLKYPEFGHNFIMFTMMWGVIKKGETDWLKVDKKAIAWYILTDYSVSNLINGLELIFDKAPTGIMNDFSANRLKLMIGQLNAKFLR